MGKNTRSLSGASQKKYFRNLFGSVEGVSPETAEVLASSCENEIAQVRVRLPIPDRRRSGASSSSGPSETNDDAPPAVFDPFAFSVVVALTKEGREGLAARLAQIETAADLQSLAKAQHVALPQGELGIEELRSAIIDGALQRIAHRKAAAS